MPNFSPAAVVSSGRVSPEGEGGRRREKEGEGRRRKEKEVEGGRRKEKEVEGSREKEREGGSGEKIEVACTYRVKEWGPFNLISQSLSHFLLLAAQEVQSQVTQWMAW